MEFDLLFFAIGIPAVIFAGISKGGFGGSASFAAAPMLALIVEPSVALGILLPLLLVMDVSALPAYWRKWDGPDARFLIWGAVPGLVLGALFYRATDPDVFRLLIGVISVLFVAWQFSQRARLMPVRMRPYPRWVGLAAGAGSGFTSFVSHAGGPILSIYLLAKRHDKLTYQATTVLIFWVVNVMKMVPFAFLGFITWQTLLAGLLLTPFAIFGTWLGVVAHRAVSERLFFAITYVLLTIVGLRLIWLSLT